MRLTLRSFKHENRKVSILPIITETITKTSHIYFNGSQLAKMTKYIPYFSLTCNIFGIGSWSKKFQLYFKNYDFCENVKFGAILGEYLIFCQ